jgi:hypothetical protein
MTIFCKCGGKIYGDYGIKRHNKTIKHQRYLDNYHNRFNVIYAIDCGCGLTYVGSTNNYNRRMIEHKSSFHNKKQQKQFNKPLYQHIRKCCEWNKIESRVITHSNNLLHDENIFIKKIGTLNSVLSIGIDKNEYSRNRNQIKFNCECGGKFSLSDKSRHLKSKKHKKINHKLFNKLSYEIVELINIF